MKSKIEIIADSLIVALKDIVRLRLEEIKSESFKLTFDFNAYSIIFLCSLHHLDMPWKISFVVEDNSKNFLRPFSKEYEITPIFLVDINRNAQVLVKTIKVDVIDLIKELQKG